MLVASFAFARALVAVPSPDALVHGRGRHADAGRDVRGGPAAAAPAAQAQTKVRVGQPVKCVRLNDGRWGATLRIGLATSRARDNPGRARNSRSNTLRLMRLSSCWSPMVFIRWRVRLAVFPRAACPR